MDAAYGDKEPLRIRRQRLARPNLRGRNEPKFALLHWMLDANHANHRQFLGEKNRWKKNRSGLWSKRWLFGVYIWPSSADRSWFAPVTVNGKPKSLNRTSNPTATSSIGFTYLYPLAVSLRSFSYISPSRATPQARWRCVTHTSSAVCAFRGGVTHGRGRVPWCPWTARFGRPRPLRSPPPATERPKGGDRWGSRR